MGSLEQGDAVALAHLAGLQHTIIPAHLPSTLYTVERFRPLESDVQLVARVARFADV
jgi:hypothetical protein